MNLLSIIVSEPILKKHAKPRRALATIVIVTLILAIQLFIKINRYAVNLFYMDQWDTYKPLFHGDNLWRIFLAQEGQLRLGVGGWVCAAVASTTAWNTRAESFVVGSIMVAIVVAALYLKLRLFGNLTFWDSIIPLIVLSATQMDVPTVVPFPSHGVVPILLLILYGICLTLQDVRLCLAALVFLNFLTLYTGWGLFLGFLTPFVLGYLAFTRSQDLTGRKKLWVISALVISIASLGSYFVGYIVYTGTQCFQFPHRPLMDYVLFFDYLFSNSVGLYCGRFRYQRQILGWFIVVFLATAWLGALWKLFRSAKHQVKSLVVGLFISFSFLFALNAMLGRVCLGVCTAEAGRYQPLLVPAWLGLYFSVIALKNKWRYAGMIVMVVGFCHAQVRSYHYEASSAYQSQMKTKWKECYLEKGDARTCDRELNFSIYPASFQVQDRLDYLKLRNLNMFSGK